MRRATAARPFVVLLARLALHPEDDKGIAMKSKRVGIGDKQSHAERAALARRRDMFIEGLANLSWPIRLNGPAAGPQRHPGNANLQFEGFSAHDILGALQPRLAASTGSACTTGIPEPSHVLRAIGLSEQQAESSIRFSLGRSTTDDDVTEAIEVLGNVLADLTNVELMETA